MLGCRVTQEADVVTKKKTFDLAFLLRVWRTLLLGRVPRSNSRWRHNELTRT